MASPSARRESPAAVWTFTIAAFVCGTLFLIVTPPFATPDENAHWRRAWHVSTGHFGAVHRQGRIGFLLPREVVHLRESFRMRPTVDPANIRAALRAPAAGTEVVFVAQPDHAYSAPIGYVPQAAGIAVARAIGGSPLQCFYAGRFANLLAGIVLVALAIRFFPSYRWLAALIALTPMANHLRGSLSFDVVTMGVAFLFIALAAHLVFLESARATWPIWTAISVLGAVLCLTKINYAPIALLPLIVPARRFRTPRMAIAARATQLVAALAGGALSAWIAIQNFAPYRTNVVIDPTAQLQHILAHPGAFARVLVDEYVLRAKWYLISMVGDLGPGSAIVVLPKILVIAYFLAMLVLLAGDTNTRLRITTVQRLIIAILCAGAAFAVALAIYMTWNPVGGHRIDGLQGRYFLPFLPAAAFLFHRSSAGLPERWRMLIVIGTVAVSTVVALYAVTERWYP